MMLIFTYWLADTTMGLNNIAQFLSTIYLDSIANEFAICMYNNEIKKP